MSKIAKEWWIGFSDSMMNSSCPITLSEKLVPNVSIPCATHIPPAFLGPVAWSLYTFQVVVSLRKYIKIVLFNWRSYLEYSLGHVAWNLYTFISQILAQIPPKTFQNPVPSDPKSIQKGSWRESGSYLGPMLEKSSAKRRPRAPKRRPRVPKRCPRGAPERPRGAQEPPKPLPNGALGDYFSCVCRFVALLLLDMAFWSDLLCVVHWFLQVSNSFGESVRFVFCLFFVFVLKIAILWILAFSLGKTIKI